MYEEREVVFRFELEPEIALWAAYAYELRAVRRVDGSVSPQVGSATGCLSTRVEGTVARVSFEACSLTMVLCPSVVAVSELSRVECVDRVEWRPPLQLLVIGL